MKGAVADEREAFVIELTGSAADYLEALRASSPKQFKNYRRLDGKLDREVGDDRTVRARTTRGRPSTQLLAWKRDQLRRTGVHDFLRARLDAEAAGRPVRHARRAVARG